MFVAVDEAQPPDVRREGVRQVVRAPFGIDVRPAASVEVVLLAHPVVVAVELRERPDAARHHRLQLVQPLCIHVRRQQRTAVADARREAHDLAQHTKRALDAHGGERDVRAADVAPGEEEVPAVAGVEAAVGHRVVRAEAAMVGRAAERLLELPRVLRVGEMEVDVPRHRRRAIGVGDVVFEVVLVEDVRAHGAVALALAADGGDPRERDVGVVRAAGGTVLEPVPVREDREKRVVADAFRLVRHVMIEAGLLFPRAGRLVVARRLVDRQRPFRDVRERRLLLPPFGQPLHAHAHHAAVGGDGGADLVEARPRLAPVHRLAAGEARDDGVARRVAEEARPDARHRARARVAGEDGGDAVRLHGVHLDGEDVLAVAARGGDAGDAAPERGDEEGRVLAVVLVEALVERTPPAEERLDLGDDLAELRVGPGVDASAEAHAHLARIAAAQHFAVLQQEGRHALARGGERRTAPREATAHDDEAPFLRVVADGAGGRARGRPLPGGGEEERVAAAVEARAVVEGDAAGPRLERRLAGALPVPVRPLRPQLRARPRRCPRPAQDDLEAAGRAARPGRVPVARPRPDGVGAVRRDLHRRLGVRHGHAAPVGHQIARPLLADGLRLDRPPAERHEAFRLHVQGRRPRPRAREQGKARRGHFRLRLHVPSLPVFNLQEDSTRPPRGGRRKDAAPIHFSAAPPEGAACFRAQRAAR